MTEEEFDLKLQMLSKALDELGVLIEEVKTLPKEEQKEIFEDEEVLKNTKLLSKEINELKINE